MWSRNGIEAACCPVTTITARSWALIEEFHLWSSAGRTVSDSLHAVSWQAYNVLLREERRLREHEW